MRRPVVTEFATRDIDVASAQMTEAYTGHRAQILGRSEDFSYVHRRIDMGGVRIDRFHTTPTVEFEVDTLGFPLVTRLVSGSIVNTTAGVVREIGPGGVFLAARPLGHFVTRLDDADCQIVGVDERIFARVEPRAVERLAHLNLTPLAPPAASAWEQTVDYVTRMTADDVAGGSPLVLGQAGRLLAATLLALFDPHQVEAASGDAADATPDTLRRAIDHIEANPASDMGVADIAAACRVTVRALQLAFRRHLDTTPMAYLRRVRLDRVQQELREADPTGGATVTETAARWGFAQLGRFSAQYREAFGESPRDTLRRG